MVDRLHYSDTASRYSCLRQGSCVSASVCLLVGLSVSRSTQKKIRMNFHKICVRSTCRSWNSEQLITYWRSRVSQMFLLGEKLHPAVNVRSRPWNNEQLITYWRPRVSQMFLLAEKLHPAVNVRSRPWKNEQLITYWRPRVSQMFLLGEKLHPAVNVRSRSWNNEQLITY